MRLYIRVDPNISFCIYSLILNTNLFLHMSFYPKKYISIVDHEPSKGVDIYFLEMQIVQYTYVGWGGSKSVLKISSSKDHFIRLQTKPLRSYEISIDYNLFKKKWIKS